MFKHVTNIKKWALIKTRTISGVLSTLCIMASEETKGIISEDSPQEYMDIQHFYIYFIYMF